MLQRFDLLVVVPRHLRILLLERNHPLAVILDYLVESLDGGQGNAVWVDRRNPLITFPKTKTA